MAACSCSACRWGSLQPGSAHGCRTAGWQQRSSSRLGLLLAALALFIADTRGSERGDSESHRRTMIESEPRF